MYIYNIIIYIYVGFQTLDDSRLSSHSGTQCGIVNEPGVLVGFTYWFLLAVSKTASYCFAACAANCVCVCVRVSKLYTPPKIAIKNKGKVTIDQWTPVGSHNFQTSPYGFAFFHRLWPLRPILLHWGVVLDVGRCSPSNVRRAASCTTAAAKRGGTQWQTPDVAMKHAAMGRKPIGRFSPSLLQMFISADWGVSSEIGV